MYTFAFQDSVLVARSNGQTTTWSIQQKEEEEGKEGEKVWEKRQKEEIIEFIFTK